jgi:peptide/nickel transport system ATP-binding protein
VSLLDVSGLHVWFDLPDGGQVHAVAGVSLALDPGERFGLVGESGCGKTTAILALMGLLPPTASVAGEVRIDGQPILSGGEESVRPYRWKEVAMVFQGAMNALNPVKKVGWQIVEPMAYHGIAEGAAARKRAGELLEMVGIPAAAAERYPHEFSGGMRQRAAIAMALACQPKVLLADEPTTALDVMVQAQILELLTGLTDELGLALVLVTHDLPVVAQVCERAAVMYSGEIVESGPVDALYHDPRHPYTRLLFAATPDLYGQEAVVSIPGAPPRLDQENPGCPFRPRCDVAIDRCASDHPALRHVTVGRQAACHRNDHDLVDVR